MRPRRAALTGSGKCLFWPFIEKVSSSVCVLPTKRAPASSIACTTGAFSVCSGLSAADRVAVAGRIAGHVEDVLDREGQAGERPARRRRDLDVAIVQECVDRIASDDHSILPCPIGAPGRQSAMPASGSTQPRVFRFAPSPNGYLHRGHAYSALLNSRAAAATGGRFLLRIEDIDRTRAPAGIRGGDLRGPRLARAGLGGAGAAFSATASPPTGGARRA